MEDGGHLGRHNCIIGQLIELPKNLGDIFVVGWHCAALVWLRWPHDETLGARCREREKTIFLVLCAKTEKSDFCTQGEFVIPPYGLTGCREISAILACGGFMEKAGDFDEFACWRPAQS
jgi:hypothetical protein